MREIKFRAWDKDMELMHIVDRIQFDVDEIDVVISKDSCSEQYYSITFAEIELMQYTGLKDKGGTEIYEGDIYKDCDGQIAKVVWHKNGFKGLYTYRRKSQGEYYTGTTYLDLNETNSRWWGIEVVGNIYENLELLEVAK